MTRDAERRPARGAERRRTAGEDVAFTVARARPVPAHVLERERRQAVYGRGIGPGGPARRIVRRGGWGGRG